MELQRHTKISQETQKTNSKIADVNSALSVITLKRNGLKAPVNMQRPMETFECATYNPSGSGV